VSDSQLLSYLSLLLAVPVGFTLGLLGGGGSILAVPIFVYVLGLDRELAIASSLAVVSATSFVGIIPHHRAANVDLKAAATFAAGSMVGAILGSDLGTRVADAYQMVLFGLVMSAAAIFMLRGKKKGSEEKHESVGVVLPILVGLGIGMLIGFVGVGGGFMYVPALFFLLAMPMNRAVGTSLLIIALNAAVAFGRYLFDDNIRDQLFSERLGDLSLVTALLIFVALTVGGVFSGAALAKKTHPAKLRKVFGLFLVGMSIYVLAKEIPRLSGT
jgi:uncharacterized membrane protein YfcA